MFSPRPCWFLQVLCCSLHVYVSPVRLFQFSTLVHVDCFRFSGVLPMPMLVLLGFAMLAPSGSLMFFPCPCWFRQVLRCANHVHVGSYRFSNVLPMSRLLALGSLVFSPCICWFFYSLWCFS